MFGEGNPASYANYTRKFAYRGLVTMENAIKALGEKRAKYFTIHLGPGAHMLHYPVANGAMCNVVAFVSDHEDWTDRTNLVKPATRAEMEKVFEGWNPCVRAMASYFPENIDKWALFDTWDHPAPFFSRDRICLVGDAAHASSPHHGAGAGVGMEDALCVSALMGELLISLKKNETTKTQGLEALFESYNAVRRTRAQWFVDSSRRVCDLFQTQEWADPEKWVKVNTCWEEVKDRSFKLWHFSPDAMVEEAIKDYLGRIQQAPPVSLNGDKQSVKITGHHGSTKAAPRTNGVHNTEQVHSATGNAGFTSVNGVEPKTTASDIHAMNKFIEGTSDAMEVDNSRSHTCGDLSTLPAA